MFNKIYFTIMLPIYTLAKEDCDTSNVCSLDNLDNNSFNYNYLYIIAGLIIITTILIIFKLRKNKK
jgi:hypothetical protein